MTFILYQPGHYILKRRDPTRTVLDFQHARRAVRFLSPFGHEFSGSTDEIAAIYLTDETPERFLIHTDDLRLHAEEHFVHGRFKGFLDLVDESPVALQHIMQPCDAWLARLEPEARQAQEMVLAVQARRAAEVALAEIREKRR